MSARTILSPSTTSALAGIQNPNSTFTVSGNTQFLQGATFNGTIVSTNNIEANNLTITSPSTSTGAISLQGSDTSTCQLYNVGGGIMTSSGAFSAQKYEGGIYTGSYGWGQLVLANTEATVNFDVSFYIPPTLSINNLIPQFTLISSNLLYISSIGMTYNNGVVSIALTVGAGGSNATLNVINYLFVLN
jgi:hypothetical protein